MRQLSDEDLDLFGVLLEERILNRLNQIERNIMSTLADLLTEDASLQDEINQVISLVQADTQLIKELQGAIGSGNLTPDQQTQVDSLFGQLTAQHDAIAAALTPVAAPAAFVVKVDGETWADYNVRLVNYNASVPIANQAPALDEATWDALPVG